MILFASMFRSIALILFLFISSNFPCKPVAPTYRGLYVDSACDIIGDIKKENELLHWSMLNNINTLTMYDAAHIARLKPLALAAFMQKAKKHYGIKTFAAVIESDSAETPVLDEYNDSGKITSQRFDYYNFELEWWNKASSFSAYMDHLKNIRHHGLQHSPIIKTEEYIGWFANPQGMDLLMADSLMRFSDRLLIHDYEKKPSWGYIRERMQWLGKAAKAQHKIFPVAVIFSAEKDFSGNYFQQHSFYDGFMEIKNAYDTAVFEGKENIGLIGYQIFTWTVVKNIAQRR